MTYLNDLLSEHITQIISAVRPVRRQCRVIGDTYVYARKVRNKVQGRARRVIKRFTVLKAKSEMRRAYNAAV